LIDDIEQTIATDQESQRISSLPEIGHIEAFARTFPFLEQTSSLVE